MLFVCFPPARPGGGPPLGHGWSRVGHDGAARTRARPVTPSHVAAGLVTEVTAPGRRPGPPCARHAGVARPRKARLRDRSAIALCGTSRHLRSSRSPLLRLRSRRCSRDLAATLRSRLRSKMSQGTKCPLPGSSCHAASSARIIPWRQPGDGAVNHPIASTALLRPDPDLLARLTTAVQYLICLLDVILALLPCCPNRLCDDSLA